MGWATTSLLASLLPDTTAPKYGGFASSGTARLHFFSFPPSPPLQCFMHPLCWHMSLRAPQKPNRDSNKPVKKIWFSEASIAAEDSELLSHSLGAFQRSMGYFCPHLCPKCLLRVSVSVCREKWQNAISLFFSFFTFLWQSFMVVFTNYIPSGLSNRLGRNPSSRQEDTIAKSTIKVVRMVEVAELTTNSKWIPSQKAYALSWCCSFKLRNVPCLWALPNILGSWGCWEGTGEQRRGNQHQGSSQPR